MSSPNTTVVTVPTMSASIASLVHSIGMVIIAICSIIVARSGVPVQPVAPPADATPTRIAPAQRQPAIIQPASFAVAAPFALSAALSDSYRANIEGCAAQEAALRSGQVRTYDDFIRSAGTVVRARRASYDALLDAAWMAHSDGAGNVKDAAGLADELHAVAMMGPTK